MSDGFWDDFQEELTAAASEFPVCENVSLVFGEGDRNAALVLLGEAPGAQEDKAKRPFVGPAGRTLDRALEEAGLSRETVWITNVVKCRPTSEGNGRLRNRPPTRGEFDQFLPWLERELEAIDPQAILCLGATAAKAVLGRSTVTMKHVRGQWLKSIRGIDTLVTYHPAYLLRRTTDQEERYAEFVSDIRLARERLSV